MDDALELIARERKEQIEKHRFSHHHDDIEHSDGMLRRMCVLALLDMPNFVSVIGTSSGDYRISCPSGWDRFSDKFSQKTDEIDKITVALALGVAELERLIRERVAERGDAQEGEG